MNLILILQIILLLTLLRVRNDGHKLLMLTAMTFMGVGAYFYLPSLNFNLVTLIFLGTFMLSLVLKRKEGLLLISIASFSMYPVTHNHSFFLQTLLYVALFASAQKDLMVREKLSFIFGLLVWPTFFVIDSLSFSYELKFLCASLLTFLLISRAQKVSLNPIAFYALLLSQVLFLKSFDYTPSFNLFFVMFTFASVVGILISKRMHSFIFSTIQVLSIIFCGMKTLLFFTSYYTTFALSDKNGVRNSNELGKYDILKMVLLILIMLFGLVAMKNIYLSISLILLMTIGNAKTFFRSLGENKLNLLEILTYLILLIMNVFVVFYV